jgi:hypothetical protein
MTHYILHLKTGKTVTAYCSDYTGTYFGSPDHVLATMKEKGYFAVDSHGEVCGLNGGIGAVNYVWSSIISIEVKA